jgi:nicotinamidase-related amidase
MTSAPVRDQLADQIITPENAAFLLIDYQPAQLAAVHSMDHELLVKNAGTSPEAHLAGLDRVIQAGGQPISWVWLACELQRDWARQDTVSAIVEIVLTDRLLKE